MSERQDIASETAGRNITSLQNARVKAIRSLEMRKVRRETGLFVAEGTSLLVSAREAGWQPRTLVCHPQRAETPIYRSLLMWAREAGAEILNVSEAVLGKLAAKDNPQAMLGVFSQTWKELPNSPKYEAGCVFVGLEEVRDPGNLGTIIRTIDAVGARGVILIGSCCDPYSHECVRATMGSVFSVPIMRASRTEFQSWVQGWRGDVVGLHLRGHDDFRKTSYRSPTLLLMGSEGPGLSTDLSAVCTRLVRIPMSGGLDSLNLAVATALTLYQVRAPYLAL